jgi:tRNA (guanine10-N2)-dimethyltransferase
LATIFFLVSGEHEDLPVSELEAILKAEKYPFRVLEKLDQIARLRVGKASVEVVRNRAALTRACALELFVCEAQLSSIARALRSSNVHLMLKEGEGFVVRVRHVKEYSSEINGMDLERRLGELLLEIVPGAKVDLKRPSKAFLGVLTSGKFVFGVKLAEIPAKPFVDRRPRKKPFFHPSAMQAKLARCMVNLAEPKAGDLLLDPFCGTGSMLIEASLIGCRAVGVDVQLRMAKGSLRNMKQLDTNAEGIIVGDVRCLPLRKIDRVVTDPPYGISSTTLKRTTKQLVEELFAKVYELLPNGNRICIASPKSLKIGQLGKAFGFRHLESHLVYVHRSLTREIAVFEKRPRK